MTPKSFFRLRGQRVVEALIKNEFEAFYCDTREEAVEEVLKRASSNLKVGIGGSVTIRELGLGEQLKIKGCRVYDLFEKGLSREEMPAVRQEHITADLFLTSTNAITLKGQLVNIDNSGNRVASMIFGPGQVVVVAGINKVVTDLEAALDRIKSYTAPRLAGYLGLKAPCAGTAYCQKCSPAHSICRVTTIIEARPKAMESFVVVLVGEQLGF
ncbi:MAG TPA: LUD domain-containing protein [Firmicutes bacterium]|nr:LUD domain-containing protein [Bacillota bacterium]